MTADELAGVTLEHLRAIRATQTDHTERFARLESRMNSLTSGCGNALRSVVYVR